MVPQMAGWKRWLGIAAVTLLTLTMVGLVYCSVRLCIFAAAPDGTLRYRLATLAIAALLLVMPGRIAWVLLRRKWKTGTFRLSPEQLAAVRARCAQPWSLRLRILTAAAGVIVAGMQTFMAFRHSPHSMNFAIVATAWWIIAGLWIHRVFKPAKCAIPRIRECLRDQFHLVLTTH